MPFCDECRTINYEDTNTTDIFLCVSQRLRIAGGKLYSTILLLLTTSQANRILENLFACNYQSYRIFDWLSWEHIILLSLYLKQIESNVDLEIVWFTKCHHVKQ